MIICKQSEMPQIEEVNELVTIEASKRYCPACMDDPCGCSLDWD